MPCPYFIPDKPLNETGWFRPPRSPLGVLHSGECQLGSIPDDLHPCNFGYARGVCPHFPSDAPFDAVRFAITSRTGHTAELLYILERNHAPAEHGKLTYDAQDNRVLSAEEKPLLAAQARAFAIALHPV